MSEGHLEEDIGLPKGLYLPTSFNRGHITQEGINVVVADKEPLSDLTMAGGAPEESRLRKAAKQALTRKRKQLEQAVNSAVNDIEVEVAKDEFLMAFNKLEEAHDKFVSAKDSDTDDPVDQAYMDEPVQEKLTVLGVYKTWDDGMKAMEKTAREEASAFRKGWQRKKRLKRPLRIKMRPW